MQLPQPLITVAPLSKTLAIILFTSLPFLGFYLGYKYKERTLASPKTCPPIPTPTIFVTPSATTNPSPLLNSLTYLYDKKKFTLKHQTIQTLNNEMVSGLYFSTSEKSSPVLSILDLSTLSSPVKSLTFITGIEDEARSDSDVALRSVKFMDKNYNFTHQLFAEGFPTEVEGKTNCVGGGGKYDDYIITENNLGIIVSRSFSLTQCDGWREDKTQPNPQTLESVLKIIESINYFP